MKFQLYLTTALLSGAAYILALFATKELTSGMFPVAPAYPVFLFLVFFATTTALLLMLFRFYRGRWLYRALFSLVAFLGLLKLFETVFPFEFSILLAALFLAGFFFISTVWTHDVIVILASAGIGSVFSLSFTEDIAFVILLILSAYDVIAVFVTKHMMTLAHAMIRSQATFALFVPERIGGFAASIASVRPGAGFLILGGGDIVLPMIYLSSVARTSMDTALYGVAGALFGQFLNHLFLVQLRRPIPALPLITLGAIVGVVIGMELL
ncbi:MAG: presenilin family intramembrane aspartyl protease [Patescibacteria group bacterium]